MTITKKNHTLCWNCQNAYVNKCIKIKTGKIDFDFIKEVNIQKDKYKWEFGTYDGIDILKCENFIQEEKRNIEEEI